MTLDEVIEKFREIADDHSDCWKHCTSNEPCGLCQRKHIQLVEWLEKLKMYEEKPDGYLANECELAGYNKAIDDLLGGMNQITYNFQNADELFEKICDMAEQLKKGAKNE